VKTDAAAVGPMAAESAPASPEMGLDLSVAGAVDDQRWPAPRHGASAAKPGADGGRQALAAGRGQINAAGLGAKALATTTLRKEAWRDVSCVRALNQTDIAFAAVRIGRHARRGRIANHQPSCGRVSVTMRRGMEANDAARAAQSSVPGRLVRTTPQ